MKCRNIRARLEVTDAFKTMKFSTNAHFGEDEELDSSDHLAGVLADAINACNQTSTHGVLLSKIISFLADTVGLNNDGIGGEMPIAMEDLYNAACKVIRLYDGFATELSAAHELAKSNPINLKPQPPSPQKYTKGDKPSDC